MTKSKLITNIIPIFIVFAYGTISGGHTETPANASIRISIHPDILSDIFTILLNGTVRALANCTENHNPSLVKYWLYTQHTDSDGELITGLEHIDSSKLIIILLHGWSGSKNSSYMAVIKDAYLQRYDANIIVVDFGPYVNSTYSRAFCNGQYVAMDVVNFICQLESKWHVNISTIHIVAHSLGAQIAGLVGKGVQDTCNKKIGRITGLDPAGPLYEGVNTNSRLDNSDAIFVDVVHTNQGQFGYVGEQGHVDFYINGGIIQPGCLSVFTNYTVLANLTVDSLYLLPINFVTCNHQRSCYLFAESIIVNSFYSTSVSSCFGMCVPDVVSTSYCYMGENLRGAPPGTNRLFACSTNDKPKYGKGPDGPLT